MEDYLITCQCNMCNVETGEVIYKNTFSKPLSSFTSDYDIYLRFFKSFERGVRKGHKVALVLTTFVDRDLPKVVEQNIVF